MKPIVFDGKLYSPCECALARPMAEQIARLRAEVETLKRELAEAKTEIRALCAGAMTDAQTIDKLTTERDRYRKALQEIVDGATIETAPAANIARRALEGDAK